MPVHRTRDIPSRSLEVTTEPALPPPTFSIVSPTPRAFTFPLNTPKATDFPSSPYSSPSSSPFEPDLRNTYTPSPPTLIRTLSPVSSITSTFSSSLNTHKRRKSTCSDVERRPKKGDEDYIKRPENAFILFRRKCCEDRVAAQEEAVSSGEGPTKKQRQADLSKTISQQWKSLSSEERLYWEELAKEKKKEHEQMYPNYVYRPQRTKDKDGKKGKKGKGKKGDELDTDSESMSFVLPWPAPATRHSRSASAPTPPIGVQAIQLPNVYMNSCPTSPSLMPMISRRSSHPSHADVPSSPFDYQPSHSLLASSFGHEPPFDGGLPSNDYFGSVFDMSGQQRLEEHTSAAVLYPIIIPQDHSQYPPSQSSGVDCSSSVESNSSPSTPHHGPYSPAGSLDCSYPISAADPIAPLDACSAEQSETQVPDMQYPPYDWDGQNIWTDGSEVLLGDDFDLNSIQPVELGLSKPGEHMDQMLAPVYSEGYPRDLGDNQFAEMNLGHDTSFDGLFGFNDMMTGQRY